MKFVNSITYLNRLILGITIILYVTVFFGLLAQILLGGFQILTAVVLLFFYKKIGKRLYKLLIFYFISVLFYGFFWVFDFVNNSIDFLWVLFYVLIPIIIACYFTFILESLNLKNEAE